MARDDERIFPATCPVGPLDTIPVSSMPLCGLQPYTVTNMPRTIGLTFTKHF